MSSVTTMRLLSIIYGLFFLKTQTYGTVLQMCVNKSLTTNEHIVLMNVHFPEHSLIGTCSCEFQTNESVLELVPGTFFHTNQDDSEPLRFRQNNFQDSYALSSDVERIPKQQFQNNTLINISIVNIDSYSNISFIMFIRSSITTDINVTCIAEAHAPRPSATTTTPSSTTTGLLEGVVSPALVIILGSLCAAFLVIILIVSVMLCCVMPRKQQAEIKKIRNSMAFVIDGDTQGHVTYRNDAYPTDGDFIRPQSHIYGNAAPKVPGQNIPNNQPTASRNALAVPSANTSYSITSDAFRQPEYQTYHNQGFQ